MLSRPVMRYMSLPVPWCSSHSIPSHSIPSHPIHGAYPIPGCLLCSACPDLSGPILPCLVLSYPVLSHPVLPCPAAPVTSCFTAPCPIPLHPSYPFLSCGTCLTPLYPILSQPILTRLNPSQLKPLPTHPNLSSWSLPVAPIESHPILFWPAPRCLSRLSYGAWPVAPVLFCSGLARSVLSLPLSLWRIPCPGLAQSGLSLPRHCGACLVPA